MRDCARLRARALKCVRAQARKLELELTLELFAKLKLGLKMELGLKLELKLELDLELGLKLKLELARDHLRSEFGSTPPYPLPIILGGSRGSPCSFIRILIRDRVEPKMCVLA